MAVRWLLGVFLLAVVCGGGRARSVEHDDDEVVTVLSGSLYALDSLSGETQHRMTRRHLGDVDNSGVQAMRLDLGPEVAALDMELTQDSAWTNDSQVLVRHGDEVEQVQGAVDSRCFLSGRLTSHDGAASLNRCGRLTGMVQTGDFHYEIQEAEEGDPESGLANVKVTMRRSVDMSPDVEGVIMDDSELGHEGMIEGDVITNTVYGNDTDSDGPSKRMGNGITAEVAAFLDANFARYMSQRRGKKTTAALTQWIVMKWNIIRNVYGNAQKIGVPFSMQLKKVEVWWKNPSFYARLGARHDTPDFVRSFCQNTPDNPNYDHKMLYTQGTGGAHMGMAFLNGICRSKLKCSLVKSKTDDVKIELHEFGHNMGLKHDPGLQPCTDPQGDGGFMGWGSNYRILDCYRRHLLRNIKQPGARCLYQQNVNLDTLNPSANANKKTSQKKKQKNNKSNKNSCN